MIDESYEVSGIAGYDGAGGNVFGDDAAGADDGAFADGDVGQDGAAGADGGALLDQGGFHLPVRLGLQAAARGWWLAGSVSLMKVTLWPMKTLSSMVTPSQMKVWLEILQFLPTAAFFWISTKAPILVLSPISQP